MLFIVDWLELAETWQAWGKGPPTDARQAPAGDIRPLRDRVVAGLRELGFCARVIYRTTQARFGDESPANLLPPRPQQDGLTVYLDFANRQLAESNIRRIIAFPDVAASSLPLLERTRLHRPKVDLSSVPTRFVFASLSELLTQAKRLRESNEDQRAARARHRQ
jgi:hypothetical protein